MECIWNQLLETYLLDINIKNINWKTYPANANTKLNSD